MCEGEDSPRMCTEVRRIAAIRGTEIVLDRGLDLEHRKGEAVGVEFVRYAWYSDVDTGTVFFHDHVNFNSWDHGLFGAHIIEPEGSTYHDPTTGAIVRSGAVVDIHAPRRASVGAGQHGSFREFVLFHHNRNAGRRGASADAPGASINLLSEPLRERAGDAADKFSSALHADPWTPLPQAYVGDPFVIRHLSVLERVGGLRMTGHRFRLERWAGNGALSDTSQIGISERFDILLDVGAGGVQRRPGDYLYYSTVARELIDGAWGIVRVHGDAQPDLRPLPDRPQVAGRDGDAHVDEDGSYGADGERDQDRYDDEGVSRVVGASPAVCPSQAPVRAYDVDITQAHIVTSDQPLRVRDGVVYRLHEDGAPPADVIAREPLVLRVNEGECLRVTLHNYLEKRASFSLGMLASDPTTSFGPPVGNNPDSTTAPGGSRTYEYYADEDYLTEKWRPRQCQPSPELFAEWAIDGGLDGVSRRQRVAKTG